MKLLVRALPLVTLASLTLGGLGTTHTALAAQSAAGRDPGAALRARVVARYPQATVAVMKLSGKSRTVAYAAVVNLLAQPGATLSGGSGAQAMEWYIETFPHQAVYALYVRELDSTGVALWQYEFVPAQKALRRYHLPVRMKESYPWYSWRLTRMDISAAAHRGAWPTSYKVHPAH